MQIEHATSKGLFYNLLMIYFVKTAKSTVEPRRKARLAVTYRHRYAQNHLNSGCVTVDAYLRLSADF